MKPILIAIAAASILCGDAALTYAQSTPSSPDHYDVPESPAQQLISANPTLALSPSTPAEVVTSATSLVNTDGRVEPGVGVELSLRAFGLGDSPRYFTGDATRVLARTSFSIATSEMGDDVALAYGLRTVIFDSSDPLMDTVYATCASPRSADERRETCEAGFHTACETQHPDDLQARESCIQSGYLSPDFATCMQEDYNACLDRQDFERSESTEWTSKALALSIAGFHRLGNGVWDEAEFGGVGLWLAAGVAIRPDRAQLDATVAYTTNAATERSTLDLALRLRGGSDSLRGFLATTYSKTQERSATIPTTAGVEVHIGNNLWATVGFGADISINPDTDTGLLALSNFTWGLGPRAPEAPQPE